MTRGAARVRSEAGVSRPEAVTIRRYDPAPISVGILFAAGLAAIWFVGLAELPGLAGGSAVAGFLILCYLMGPSAHVRVGASAVVVANTFVRTRIPREAIREVAGWDWEEVVIYLLDGRRIPVSALQSWLITRSPRGHRKRAKMLERALGAVPAVAAGGTLQRRVRYANTLLALVGLTAVGVALGSIL